MKLETFKYLITQLDKQVDLTVKLIELGVDLVEYDERWLNLINILLNVYYGEIGGDWISWYIYEKQMSDPPLKAFDEQNNEICFDIPSLWNHVESLRVSDSYKEYELPEKKTISDSDIDSLLNTLTR